VKELIEMTLMKVTDGKLKQMRLDTNVLF